MESLTQTQATQGGASATTEDDVMDVSQLMNTAWKAHEIINT
jgi:hypothetical protein